MDEVTLIPPECEDGVRWPPGGPPDGGKRLCEWCAAAASAAAGE
jgi:hypothetical protein